MLRAGQAVGDGTWTLAVFVTDLQVEKTLRVRGDLHIGGAMIRLVDELGKKRICGCYYSHVVKRRLKAYSLKHVNSHPVFGVETFCGALGFILSLFIELECSASFQNCFKNQHKYFQH